MKKEIRVIGIDDVSFDKHKHVKVIGVMFRGGQFMDGVLSTLVKRDGNDATSRISEMVQNSRFKKQLQYILLDGIAVAGFNVVDIEELNEKTGLPVIVVTRNYPDFEEIFSVLEKLNMDGKIHLIKKAGIPLKHNKIFFQFCGTDETRAREILELTSTHSFIPEPIRVAHLIGQGITFGESHGRA